MLTIVLTSNFKKDVKLMKKRNKDISLLNEVINRLANKEVLEERYKDHILIGDYVGIKECHIQPDWLLLYKICDGINQLRLIRTGTHSDLFE